MRALAFLALNASIISACNAGEQKASAPTQAQTPSRTALTVIKGRDLQEIIENSTITDHVDPRKSAAFETFRSSGRYSAFYTDPAPGDVAGTYRIDGDGVCATTSFTICYRFYRDGSGNIFRSVMDGNTNFDPIRVYIKKVAE